MDRAVAAAAGAERARAGRRHGNNDPSVALLCCAQASGSSNPPTQAAAPARASERAREKIGERRVPIFQGVSACVWVGRVYGVYV